MPGYRRIADEVTHRAQDVYEHVRAINHSTITRPPLPASDVYPALTALAETGHALGQAIGQLAECLDRSATEYELRNDDNTDPLATLAQARRQLVTAEANARRLGSDLAAACTLLARQGHRGPRTASPTATSQTGTPREWALR
ncbi:MAG TPA: hypothetical protein VFP89_15100 [Propionibacteriaceae bacterium]|nr:hypothetical protein [Propionibacteriaceae bacterium]